MTSEIRAVNVAASEQPMTTPLSALEARVMGCLIEKELATPDIYPLTLNALVNACNQRNNREPIMAVGGREVEVALEQLRLQQLVTHFAGADARVAKFKQRFEVVYPMDTAARALMGELLLRGPQTAAGMRGNAERLCTMPPLAEIEAILGELAQRPAGALVRKLARQPGQKEARWAQLLTGEPAIAMNGGPESAMPVEPLTVTIVLPPEVEKRLGALEAETKALRAELAKLRAALGEG
jgi:uncharacterized protein